MTDKAERKKSWKEATVGIADLFIDVYNRVNKDTKEDFVSVSLDGMNLGKEFFSNSDFADVMQARFEEKGLAYGVEANFETLFVMSLGKLKNDILSKPTLIVENMEKLQEEVAKHEDYDSFVDHVVENAKLKSERH